MSDDMQSLAKEKEADDAGAGKDDLGIAIFIAGSALFVIAGLVVSVVVLFKRTSSAPDPGPFAAAALVLILLQAAVGFPVNNDIAEGKQQAPGDEEKLAAAMTATMEIKAERTSWFYLELALLAIPSGLYIYRRLP